MDWVHFSVFQLFPWIQLFHLTICKIQFDHIHSYCYCYFTFFFQQSQFNYQNVQRALVAFTVNLCFIRFPSPLVTNPVGFQSLAVCRTPSMYLVPWKENPLNTSVPNYLARRHCFCGMMSILTRLNAIVINTGNCNSIPLLWCIQINISMSIVWPYCSFIRFNFHIQFSISFFWYAYIQNTSTNRQESMNSSPHNSVRCHFSWQEACSWKTSTQLYTRRGTWHFFALRDKSPRTQIITTHYGVVSQDKDVLGRPVSSTAVAVVHDISLLCLTWGQNSYYYQYHYAQLPWQEARSWRVCLRYTASRPTPKFHYSMINTSWAIKLLFSHYISLHSMRDSLLYFENNSHYDSCYV
jgi:hypothetical protein